MGFVGGREPVGSRQGIPASGEVPSTRQSLNRRSGAQAGLSPLFQRLKKTKALEYGRKCTPKFNDRELCTLPYETEPNWRSWRFKSGHVYIKKDIMDLVNRKAEALSVMAVCPPRAYTSRSSRRSTEQEFCTVRQRRPREDSAKNGSQNVPSNI